MSLRTGASDDADGGGGEGPPQLRAVSTPPAGSVASADALLTRAGADRQIAALHPDTAPTGPGGVRTVALSEVERERVTWLWDGYIPAGKLTVIDGDPGDGKSTLTCDLAARITRGGPMPDGNPGSGEPGHVLLLSAEDGIADTIAPRLAAAGADLAAVTAVEDVDGTDGQPRPVELPGDLPLIAELVAKQRAALVVIDPLMAFLAGVDSHNDQSVRRALHPLAQLADRSGAAFLVVRHLNKGAGKAIYRGGGSIGIVGAARAAYLVAPDPDDAGRRLLATVKMNLGPHSPTLAYRLVDDPEHGCARVTWEGASPYKANQLAALSGEDTGERDQAAEYLRTALAKGPRRSREVEEEAREMWGISPATLRRARMQLHVRAERMNGAWWMSLPNEVESGNG